MKIIYLYRTQRVTLRVALNRVADAIVALRQNKNINILSIKG